MKADKRIRAFLNKFIKGKFTNALISALGESDDQNEALILECKKNIFLATAEGAFLEKIAANKGIIKPKGVGMDDDAFRNMVSVLSNQQLLTNTFLTILEQFYGVEATHANVINNNFGPYQLEDGMVIQIEDDSKNISNIEFKASDFTNINQATAKEISYVISKTSLQLGRTFFAQEYVDLSTGNKFIQLFSGTKGPLSYIKIVGGTAQPVLQFPELRPTSQISGTQFTSSLTYNRIRYTWTSGTNPNLQSVSVGDYVVLKYPAFPLNESGSYTVVKVVPDVLGAGYFEVENPLINSGTVTTIGNSTDIQFFNPKKFTIADLVRKASIYEVNPKEVVIYLPVTSKTITRNLIGAWHPHGSYTDDSYLGSYIYNPKSGFAISGVDCTVTTNLNAGQVYTVISTSNSTAKFPDTEGYVVFDYGFDNQEGPVRYFGKASDKSLILDASYTFKKDHSNSNCTLLRTTRPYSPLPDGSDYQAYLTGTAVPRSELIKILTDMTASGIFVNLILVYPAGPGLSSTTEPYEV